MLSENIKNYDLLAGALIRPYNGKKSEEGARYFQENFYTIYISQKKLTQANRTLQLSSYSSKRTNEPAYETMRLYERKMKEE